MRGGGAPLQHWFEKGGVPWSSISHPPGGGNSGSRAGPRYSVLRKSGRRLRSPRCGSQVSATAVWGSDFVGSSNDGNNTTIPSGIFVGLFATIGTWALAKYALGNARKEH